MKAIEFANIVEAGFTFEKTSRVSISGFFVSVQLISTIAFDELCNSPSLAEITRATCIRWGCYILYVCEYGETRSDEQESLECLNHDQIQ